MDPAEQVLVAIESLRSVMGSELDQILAKDLLAASGRRGLRHRLAMAISEWTAARARGETDLGWATEIDIAARVFTHWSGHPIWEEVLPSLRNPTNYPHALVSLAAAVELGAEPALAGPERLADLRVAHPGCAPYRAEVKCPLALQHPEPNLEGDRGRKVIKSCVSKAGSSPGGQLAGPEATMLVVGAFHLNVAQVVDLEAGARRELGAVARPNVAGIMLLHWLVVVDGLVLYSDTRSLRAGAEVHGILRKVWVPNPSHDGRVRIEIVANGPAFSTLEEVRAKGDPSADW